MVILTSLIRVIQKKLVKEWVKEDHITLEAYDKYWNGPAEIKEVIFRPISNEATRTASLIIALTLVGWVTFARTVRGATLAERNKEYVEAARVCGFPNRVIMFKHILPNVLTPLIVIGTLQVGNFILTEATLSFLGVGAPVTQPSLGLLLATGYQVLFSGLWWVSVFPGLVLLLMIVGTNLLGDFLRDELNPRLK